MKSPDYNGEKKEKREKKTVHITQSDYIPLHVDKRNLYTSYYRPIGLFPDMDKVKIQKNPLTILKKSFPSDLAQPLPRPVSQEHTGDGLLICGVAPFLQPLTPRQSMVSFPMYSSSDQLTVLMRHPVMMQTRKPCPMGTR